MTPTQTQLAAATEALESVGTANTCLYTNGIALRDRAEKNRLAFMANISGTCGDGNPLDPNRGHPNIAWLLGSEAAQSFAVESAVASAVWNSPEFIAAHEIVHPLVESVRQLQDQFATETHASNQAAAERQAQLDEAKAAAIAKIEAEFAPAEPPAPVEPEPPFRGKVKREAVPA